MRTRRRFGATLSVLALVASLAVVALPATAAFGATVTNPNACSTVVSPDPFELPITITGAATPDPVDVGVPGAIGLTTSVDVLFPGSFIDAGIGLTLISPGDLIPADITVEILGSNVDEGSFSDTVPVLLGPVALVDPALPWDVVTNPALPAFATVVLAPSTWTATSTGPVDFAQGDLSIAADLGFAIVTVDCFPGTVDDGPPIVVTPIPATPYASVNDGSPGTTTTTGGTTTTTGGSTTTTTTEPEFVTGTASYATNCTNSLTPDLTELAFEITGTVPGEVNAGETFVLSDQTWEVAIPGSVFQAGIGLGLISAGDTVNATVDATVFASNTVEGLQTAAGIAVQFGPIEVDGDGQALDATSVFNPDDLTFTAVGGDSAIEMSGASVAVDLGLPVDVGFTCVPVTSGVAFVTATVIGDSDLTAATTTTTTPAGPGATVAGTATAAGSAPAGTSTGSTGGATLPLTGPGSWIAMVIFGLVAIDLGYLLWSATKPPRRRRLADS